MAKERAAEKSAELKEPKVKKLSAEDKVIKTSKNKDKKEKKEKKSKKHAKIEEELASKPEVEDQTKPKNADAKQEAVSPSKEPEAAPDYMSLDESEPEPVSQKPSKKASKKEARQKTSDSPKVADTESKSKKTSDSPKPKKTSDEKEPKSKKSKDKKKSEDKVEASKDGKKAGKEDAKKAEKKAPVSSAVEVELTKDEEKNDSSSDSDSDSEEGGAKVEDTKAKSTNTTGPNRHARRRLILIDRQKIKIQKRLGVEEGSTEPNEEVDKALEEWTKNFDELNAQSVKKKAVRAKQALKKRNDNHKRTTKGLTTKQLDKIHKRRNAKRDAKFAAPAA